MVMSEECSVGQARVLIPRYSQSGEKPTPSSTANDRFELVVIRFDQDQTGGTNGNRRDAALPPVLGGGPGGRGLVLVEVDVVVGDAEAVEQGARAAAIWAPPRAIVGDVGGLPRTRRGIKFRALP